MKFIFLRDVHVHSASQLKWPNDCQAHGDILLRFFFLFYILYNFRHGGCPKNILYQYA